MIPGCLRCRHRLNLLRSQLITCTEVTSTPQQSWSSVWMSSLATTAVAPKQEEESVPKKKRKYTKKSKVVVAKPLEVKTKDKKSPSSLSSTTKLILEYVKKQSGINNGDLIGLLPKQFLKSTSIIPTTAYLVDQTEAKVFSKAIKEENPDKDAPVLELHPGLGLLTDKLLNEVGFKHVTCLEDNGPLGEHVASQYNVSVVDCSMDDLPRHNHLDKHDGGERIDSILTSIDTGEEGWGQKRAVDNKKPLYIVGALPNIGAINFLIRCYVTKRVFFENELPWSRAGVVFFIALGAKAEHICKATQENGLVAYRPTSVFFQTLFTYKELGTLSRKAFIPWEVHQNQDGLKGPKKKKLKIEDPTILKLMRVEINREVEEKIGKDNLFIYWYFVRQHLYARTNRIVPELERWVPGCGVKLIKQGFTIYSQFGMLTPEEVLKLYLEFVSWPEFKNSSFLNAVEKFQTRLELTDEEEESK